MIPKILHYTWFGGGELSKRAKQAFKSWKKHLPDFEFMLWNENNSDFDENAYAKKAYELKRYMYVSDYVRLKKLYEYGGFYLDVDTIVKKSIVPLMDCEGFIGFGADNDEVTANCFAVEKGHPFIKEMLERYKELEFVNKNGEINTVSINMRMRDLLREKGLNSKGEYQELFGLRVYPMTYFSPKSMVPDKVKDCMSKNTYCYHEWDAKWLKRERSLRVRIARKLGLNKLKRILKK